MQEIKIIEKIPTKYGLSFNTLILSTAFGTVKIEFVPHRDERDEELRKKIEKEEQEFYANGGEDIDVGYGCDFDPIESSHSISIWGGYEGCYYKATVIDGKYQAHTNLDDDIIKTEDDIPTNETNALCQLLSYLGHKYAFFGIEKAKGRL